MTINPAALIIAGVFSGIGHVPVASATDLPSNVRATAQSLGIPVQSDGSFSYNATRYVPLLPQGYSSSQQASGQPQARSDGSIVWGNLQFAPVVQMPGELPHLPDNLQPLSGNSLPSDFQPPAGFVASGGVSLPAGVTVPPLTPAAMIQQMVDAGALPQGLVQFNSDGTVSVQGGQSFLPFLPPISERGVPRSFTNRTFQIGANGVVTFPDGSAYAPVVSGSTAGGTTLPRDFTPPAGTSLPATAGLPLQFEIPANVRIPSGMTLPAGVVFPERYSIPSGTRLPPGVSIPASATVAAGVTVPDGITLPAGTQISTTALPQGTTILPSGALVIPGNQIPSGVTPPSSWTLPTGATRASDGTYRLPTPPATGFPPQAMPLRLNADGSAVMPAPAPGALPPPTGSVLNADGTITVPPPPFIGSVGSGGVVQSPGFGVSTPPSFHPQVPTGTLLPGAGMPPPSGQTSPGSGATPPSDGGDNTPTPPPSYPYCYYYPPC